MISFIKRITEKVVTAVVSFVRKILTLLTYFSFGFLFVKFFMYMFSGEPFMCLVCLAGIYTFIHLNKVL